MDFFRPDTNTDFYSLLMADTDFLKPIFGTDTAFASSIYIKKNYTMMITNVTRLDLKKEHLLNCLYHATLSSSVRLRGAGGVTLALCYGCINVGTIGDHSPHMSRL